MQPGSFYIPGEVFVAVEIFSTPNIIESSFGRSTGFSLGVTYFSRLGAEAFLDPPLFSYRDIGGLILESL